jgi:hypothetical protein
VTNVYRLRLVPPAPDPAYDRLCRTRKAFNLALLAWLKERQPRAYVELECDASIVTIRLLSRLDVGRQP